MEKVGVLINRLQQQFNQQAGSFSLLSTALLLVAELQTQPVTETSPGKISVIMPYKPFELINRVGNHKDEIINNKDEIINNKDEISTTNEVTVEPSLPQETPEAEKLPAQEVSQPEYAQTSAINTLAEEKYNEEMEEVPTLAQQQPKVLFELNDTVPGELSINDKLKQQVAETGGKLQNEPIKDLRKGIGINDKYLFIRELFRNDEVAYERSIKTINSFSILPEAEYWIQREMKYKLGWDDSNPVVKSFYQLVKRRFS